MNDRVISHEVPAYGPASLNMLSEFENATTSNRLKVFSSFEDFSKIRTRMAKLCICIVSWTGNNLEGNFT